MAQLFLFASYLICMGCFLSAQVHAATFEIGRASVEMPAGVWKQVTNSEGATLLDGGATGSIPTDDRIFGLMDGERVVAILLISSSKGGTIIRTNWTNNCASTKNSYASNIAFHVNGLGCARATGRLNTIAYLRLAVPKMFKALEAIEPALPPISHSVSAVVANDNGTMLYVNLVTIPAFAGSSEKPLVSVPDGINPRHAAWADRLAVAIRESVYSMSGKLVIPSVDFVTSPKLIQPVTSSK